VVVKDISRLARNTVDFLTSIRELKSLGINVLFVNANMDSLGESEFVLAVFAAMAQEESANLSKRVKFGKKINAQKGRVPQRIYGYDRIDNFTLRINYSEAQIVQEIYNLYLDDGLGYRTICIALNNEGRKTKYGGAWEPKAVKRILTNPIYCGHYVNHKYEIGDYLTGKQVKIPESEHFHHERPEWAIVTPERFAQVQVQLDARKVQYNSGEPFREARFSTKHLFSTLIKCEHCGRSFCQKHYKYVNARVYWKCVTNDQYTAQKCDNRIKLEESDLLDELRAYFQSLIGDKDAFVAGILADLEQHPIEKAPLDRAQIEKRQKDLLAKKERYQEMYANDAMTMDELKAKVAKVTAELQALECDLVSYERHEQAKTDTGRLVERYRQEIERFLNLETVTNMDLRRVIDHISVNRDGNVTVFLKKLNDLSDFLGSPICGQ
jgi:hypothetical protein